MIDVRKYLSYDRNTGLFHWLPRTNPQFNGKHAGTIAGSLSKGYVIIKINKKIYLAHRLAWLYVTGEWPIHEIDHINKIRNDNRFANLRLATHIENGHNKGITKANSTGVTGVTKHRKKWQAQIRVEGRLIHLGVFHSFEEAVDKRKQAELEYFKPAPVGAIQ